jgi:hypothetical protein
VIAPVIFYTRYFTLGWMLYVYLTLFLRCFAFLRFSPMLTFLLHLLDKGPTVTYRFGWWQTLATPTQVRQLLYCCGGFVGMCHGWGGLGGLLQPFTKNTSVLTSVDKGLTLS